MSGLITTHVLDLAGGRAVVGIAIELWYLGDDVRGSSTASELVGTFITNDDGRVERPLLEGAALKSGVYELIFAAGDYFRSSQHLAEIGDSLFDFIPIQFRIMDKNAHYHVPLLVAPGGYSTYRGT